MDLLFPFSVETTTTWSLRNSSLNFNKKMRLVIDSLEGRELPRSKLSGIRKEIIGWITDLGEKSELDGIDIEIGSTGVVVQVSHSQAARGRILDAMSHVQEGSIDSMVFITQTNNLAVVRNRVKNPESDSTGHRVYFEDISKRIDVFANSIFTAPTGVIGLDAL